MNKRIGIIGGSGLYELEALTDIGTMDVKTPFGDPSDAYITGTLNGVPVAFLPRHGRAHCITPSELNFRANIYGFKKLGVEQIIAVTAVGSLREAIEPLQIVIPDQFYDRTRSRADSFFGKGIVAHVPFADPVCPDLSRLLGDCATGAGAAVHRGGTLVCMEGPAFSTRAEANVYRSQGMDIVGMTVLQEAKLAREAEICYAVLALVTDYDCWYEAAEEVSVAQVVENLKRNTVTAKKIIQTAISGIPGQRTCICEGALNGAIMTDPAAVPPATLEKLEPIVGRYLTNAHP
jgi:5'-methylthioadenosine phosphorylase